MALQLSTFNQFVSGMATTLANSTKKVTNLQPGSAAFALLQAAAGLAISLQAKIAAVANMTRLGTSQGNDVDTYIGDFGMKRIPASFSTIPLQVNRNDTSGPLSIPLDGSSVAQTNINGIQFSPTADVNQTAYDPVNNVYTFEEGVSEITVTMKCLTAGSIGNIGANSLQTIVSGFVGCSTINNTIGTNNGKDKETDPAAKARFPVYLGSLKTSNNDSIEEAVLGVQPNVTYQIIENKHFDGSAFVAGFCVVVDDGSGAPSTPFVTAVTSAVDASRAAGIEFEVHTPSVITANVSVHITVGPGGNLALTQAAVTAAITAYIKALGVGENVVYVNLADAIQNVAGVYAYTSLLINGGSSDIAIAQTQIAEPGTISYT